MTNYYLACDLGADSGRLMLGTLDGSKLTLDQIHRFPNGPIKADDSLHWDTPKLFKELKAGLKKAAKLKLPIASISCDSWGVDYLLLNQSGKIISPAFHYRDPRTQKGVENCKAKVDWPAIFAETGIQFMPLNTIYQLAAESSERLAKTHQLLCIGDGFNYLLCGIGKNEESLASTTQLYNPRTRTWSKQLIETLGLPAGIFTEIVPSGTRLGPLRPEIAKATGLSGVQVIASCSHDTGAAVAAVPASGKDWAYLSSGTWSLIGVELPKPIITDECREWNVTNEIGFGGSVRFLKNIIGLWLVQECRREWAAQGQQYDFAALEEMATAAPPFVSLINPADPRFLSPGDMPAKIAAVCQELKQPVPADPGAMIRCVYESLALLYRRTLHRIERLANRNVKRVHIVGGGSKDATLNQFTANALQIPVLAGPAEATAIGNLLVQAITLGHLPSLAAARRVVRDSLEIVTVEPKAAKEWNQAYKRFEGLVV
jgi:rhamnulokinase